MLYVNNWCVGGSRDRLLLPRQTGVTMKLMSVFRVQHAAITLSVMMCTHTCTCMRQQTHLAASIFARLSFLRAPAACTLPEPPSQLSLSSSLMLPLSDDTTAAHTARTSAGLLTPARAGGTPDAGEGQ